MVRVLFLLLCLAGCLSASACGVKGPPRPPVEKADTPAPDGGVALTDRG